MTPELTNKIENLLKITPNFKLDSFIVFNDRDGWTDGFIADLTNINFETVKVQAIIKHAKLKPSQSMRFVLEKENAPKFSQIEGSILDSKVVDDIELDLRDNMVFLKAGNMKVKFNPCYLKYFANAYKELWGSLEIKVTEELTPISIYIGGSRVGVIMPIRQS